MMYALGGWAVQVGSLLVAAPKIPDAKGPEFGKAAPIGLLILLCLCLAMTFLMRSMFSHLRKVRASAAAGEVAVDPASAHVAVTEAATAAATGPAAVEVTDEHPDPR